MQNKILNLNRSTQDLLEWTDRPVSKDVIGRDSIVASKKRQLKKYNWRIEKLRQSLTRNSAVSVYGPSQAGKSF